jgi:hypothetical protein
LDARRSTCGSTARAATTSTPATAQARRGLMIAAKPRSNTGAAQPAKRPRLPAPPPRSRRAARVGVSVNAATIDASTARAKVSTSGRLNAVTSVPRKRSGSVASRIARTPKTSGPRTEAKAARMVALAGSAPPISRGRIFHRASTDMSMRETCRDDSLIMAIRLAEAVGWIMIGGLPTLGRACAWVIRSWTICRAA